ARAPPWVVRRIPHLTPSTHAQGGFDAALWWHRLPTSVPSHQTGPAHERSDPGRDRALPARRLDYPKAARRSQGGSGSVSGWIWAASHSAKACDRPARLGRLDPFAARDRSSPSICGLLAPAPERYGVRALA